jgi:hypothetical protein
MNGLPCSSLTIEAVEAHISIVLQISLLADTPYPVTYQYLGGIKLAKAREQKEASVKKIDILIAILRDLDSFKTASYFPSNSNRTPKAAISFQSRADRNIFYLPFEFLQFRTFAVSL